MGVNGSLGAIVTGSDSGIGRATALALAADGFDVGVTWHSDEGGALETAADVRRRGRRAVIRHLDLRDSAGAAATVARLADELGQLRVLVNSAAVDHRGPFLDLPLDDWRAVLETNLTGCFSCAQAAARIMVAQEAGGRIINVTSVHEHVPLKTGAAYAAAKAGLGMLTKVMALELAPFAITVNAVAPGHVATPMTGHASGSALPLRETVPVGRTGAASEIAAAIRYLASNAAAFTTGHSLVVDGGLGLVAAVGLQRELDDAVRSSDLPIPG